MGCGECFAFGRRCGGSLWPRCLECSWQKKMKGDFRGWSSEFILVLNTTSTSTSTSPVELGQHSLASPLTSLMKRLILVLMSYGWAPLVWDSWTWFIQATDKRRATPNVNGYSSIWLCYLLSCISIWVIGCAARISAAPAHILSWAKPASCVIIIIHCNLVWADYLSLPWVTGLIFLCWSKTRGKKYRHSWILTAYWSSLPQLLQRMERFETWTAFIACTPLRY